MWTTRHTPVHGTDQATLYPPSKYNISVTIYQSVHSVACSIYSWELRKDHRTGRDYYAERNTQTTTWDRPSMQAVKIGRLYKHGPTFTIFFILCMHNVLVD